ncbi:mechanosensitive ion channel family protein [Flavobacterium agrisoli]|uniref:Mechanosensitive ion channel n=1 Tax=Flavobacterium agrisoli TaxID=2793066 RepID=A0A934PPM5_9FLAO|nr:mechanosensitive ion channel domain-containing protein [Flavobacterium agrisoli]MBK0370273.1 mechanosensitive ion channel [Flavobacterium agrisoli]
MEQEHQKIALYIQKIIDMMIGYSPKLISAFLILFIGLYLIRIINRLIRKIMIRRNLDPTLTKFLADLLLWALRILLFVTFISKLGIETSSFVAILGAIGLAVGLSLQGSLSNLAGGVLIIVFKPFRDGDLIEAQGITGTVSEIQLFVTKLIAANNQTVFIPNGPLSNGSIINYSMQGHRRAEFTFTIAYDADIKTVKQIILNLLLNDPNVLKTPAPRVFVKSLADNGIVLAVYPWAKNEDFDAVSTNTLENCKYALENAGINMQPYVQELSKTNLQE